MAGRAHLPSLQRKWGGQWCGLLWHLVRVCLGYKQLGLGPVILWSLLLRRAWGEGLPGDPWPSVLKPSFPPFPSPQDMFDKTKSSRMDVYGFSALWKFIQQWKNLFQQYDRDHSGSISYTELQQGEAVAGLSAQSQTQRRVSLALPTRCPLHCTRLPRHRPPLSLL